jgi:peptidoglycan/xylan/chitin deacetylase (PgdA/CDA1 family)
VNLCLTLLHTLVTLLLLAFAVAPPVAHATDPSQDIVWDGVWRQIDLPILMYHYVSPLPADADRIRTDLTVSPELFRQHMQYLYDNDYTTVSLHDLYAALMVGAPLPERAIALTFDDGYIDHYQYVFPILREFGFTGTFFIISGITDRQSYGHMNWAQIEEMSRAGMSMEPHTIDHIQLNQRSHDELVYQILGSIETLEAHTGRPARIFSYPSGRYDAATLRVLRTTQIWLAVSTRNGRTHTPNRRLNLSRIRISNTTNATTFASLVG